MMAKECESEKYNLTSGEHESEDMDVLWEGSPLHEHLVQAELNILPDSCIEAEVAPSWSLNDEVEDRHVKTEDSPLSPMKSDERNISKNEYDNVIQNDSCSLVPSTTNSISWPDTQRLEVLQVDVARHLIASDLLVQEDEDFINNFLLTDAALEDYQRYTTEGGTSSVLSDVLLFSGR